MVKISVVIPAYNEEKLIASCIDAVSNQTLPKEDYEIIVVSNNSHDKTAEIARQHGARVLDYTEKQGFAVTRQFGTKHAKADIIAYIDADTIPKTDWLEETYRLYQNKKLMCVGGTVLPRGSNIISQLMFVFYDLVCRVNQLFGLSLLWGPNMSVRKAAFEAIHGFNTDLVISEDWDFVVRIQKKFGWRSTLYTGRLVTWTSPRKQENFMTLLKYCVNGFINYFLIFIFRRSVAFGLPDTLR